MSQEEQWFIRSYERWVYYSETGNQSKADSEIENARRWWQKMSKVQRSAHVDKAERLRSKK